MAEEKFLIQILETISQASLKMDTSTDPLLLLYMIIMKKQVSVSLEENSNSTLKINKNQIMERDIEF